MVASLISASLSFGAVTVVPILMQPMALDLGWTRSTLGLAHSLAMVSAGMGGLLIGYLADRRSFSLLAVGGACGIAVGLWSASKASQPSEFYAAYALFVGALGQGTFFGPVTANVSQWFDRNRTLAMAVVLCGQSVGGLTVPVSLRALAEAWGWRDAMASYGIVCGLVIGACAMVFVRKPPLQRERGRRADARAVATGDAQWRIFMGTTAALVLLNTGSFIIIAHMTAYAEEQGLAPTLGAGLLSTLLGSTLFFRLLGGLMVDRRGAPMVLAICTLMLPAGGGLLGFGAGALYLMVIGAVVFGLGYGGAFPALTGIIRMTFPSSVAGTWISRLFLFGFIAAAIGSWSGGYLRDLTGNYETSLWFSVALTLASFVITLLFLRGPFETASNTARATATIG